MDIIDAEQEEIEPIDNDEMFSECDIVQELEEEDTVVVPRTTRRTRSRLGRPADILTPNDLEQVVKNAEKPPQIDPEQEKIKTIDKDEMLPEGDIVQEEEEEQKDSVVVTTRRTRSRNRSGRSAVILHPNDLEEVVKNVGESSQIEPVHQEKMLPEGNVIQEEGEDDSLVVPTADKEESQQQ